MPSPSITAAGSKLRSAGMSTSVSEWWSTDGGPGVCEEPGVWAPPPPPGVCAEPGVCGV